MNYRLELGAGALVDVFEAALYAGKKEYLAQVVACLQAQIGFDGLVLGAGSRQANGGVTILQADIDGRPDSLVSDFRDIAADDTVSHRFAAAPGALQNIRVAAYYKGRQADRVVDYLDRYRVRQLMICGEEIVQSRNLEWINFYREDRCRPFAQEDEQFVSSIVSAILLAGRLRRSKLLRGQAGLVHAPSLLTPRELEIALSYANGSCYKAVAKVLGISPATVRCHLLAVYRKMDVHNKLELHRHLAQGGVGHVKSD